MHNEKKQQQRDISTKSIEKVAQVYKFFSYLFQKTFADCSHHLNDYRVPLKGALTIQFLCLSFDLKNSYIYRLIEKLNSHQPVFKKFLDYLKNQKKIKSVK